MLRILFLGDIVGKSGRKIVANVLPELREEFSPSVVIANGENSAGGLGIDQKCAKAIYAAGVDLITTGNHIWKRADIREYLESEKSRIVRPLNFPPGAPGFGVMKWKSKSGELLGVVNAQGRIFMPDTIDCPFQALAKALEAELGDCDQVFVDFHAEATSEKLAIGHFLDGKVSAVVGTHTHVQTADNKILPGGTAYISDVGMCGPEDSVIGVKKELIIERFQSALPARFDLASGPTILCGVLIDCAEGARGAVAIERIYRVYD